MPFPVPNSRFNSARPSIITKLSSDLSDVASRRSLWETSVEHRSIKDERVEGPRSSLTARTVSDRALAWQDRGLATPMLRTASDGADVAIEENGMEWQVINPRGTCKGQHRVDDTWITKLSRRSAHMISRVAFRADQQSVTHCKIEWHTRRFGYLQREFHSLILPRVLR